METDTTEHEPISSFEIYHLESTNNTLNQIESLSTKADQIVGKCCQTLRKFTLVKRTTDFCTRIRPLFLEKAYQNFPGAVSAAVTIINAQIMPVSFTLGAFLGLLYSTSERMSQGVLEDLKTRINAFEKSDDSKRHLSIIKRIEEFGKNNIPSSFTTGHFRGLGMLACTLYSVDSLSLTAWRIGSAAAALNGFFAGSHFNHKHVSKII